MLPLTKSTLQFQRSLARVIGFPILVLALLAGILVLQILNLLSLAAWVDHTDQVIAQATLTQKLMLDQQTGRRGYMIGGEPKFLAPARLADAQIGPAFDRLKNLIADNPQQVERAETLRRSYYTWNQNSQLEMALYQRNPILARAYFNRGVGKSRMDDLRAQMTVFLSAADALRAERQQVAQSATRRTLVGLAALAIVTGFLLGIVLARQIRRVSGQYETALKDSYEAAALNATTLQSIGDAVMVTDAAGKITGMNPVAEELTGWTLAEAQGLKAEKVFVIVNETSRLLVESPIDRVLRDGVIVGLANHTVLLRRGGVEVPIDDSGAPIRAEDGSIAGAVLVFRDITERRRVERDRAERYEKEHRIAESLQRSLLNRPLSEALGGLTVETFYQAAWREAEVGGDFYDIFALEEGKIALVVGDVSGKGLLAASRTAEAKYTLRAYLREYPYAATALNRLNAFLCEAKTLGGEEAEYFLCLTLAIVSPATGQMEVAAAGMETPLLLHQDGSITEVPVQGLPLGILPETSYEVAERTLEHGGRLIVATDGITEARQGLDMLGNDGMGRLAAQALPAASLQALGQAIVDGSRTYSGGEFRDDVCLLLTELTV